MVPPPATAVFDAPVEDGNVLVASHRCPVPRVGRRVMVAVGISLALHAVAIGGAEWWVLRHGNQVTVCPVTQFMRVHLLRPTPSPTDTLPVPARTVKPVKVAPTKHDLPVVKAPVTKSYQVTPPHAVHTRPSELRLSLMAAPKQREAVVTGNAPMASGGTLAPAAVVPARVADGMWTAIPYPAMARERGWEGTVKLRVKVDELGAVQDVQVAEGSGFDMLDKQAAKVVAGWKFEPRRENGAAVAGWVGLPITFRLTD